MSVKDKILELIGEDQNCDYETKGDDYSPIMTEAEADEARDWISVN